eukprot:CAMPEP_0174831168 /NCGR_PEP_ID=MMETSP1114-20130205/2948_1 /TAXON_ID=312471 /ORGANISM="Neobodo designis, Strain CCAP 1951/1" /LENGTH=226 /DNA_ID=CAMNT_0016064989 /DNA_START=108 /DNA_END=788 /DNA_ORIENTATION=+
MSDTSSGEVTPMRTPRRMSPTLGGPSNGAPRGGSPVDDTETTSTKPNKEPVVLGGSNDGFQIVLVPPETDGNFTAFNKMCDDLDSEFLMQPINEADYDSETQACVDKNTGGPASFYDHYVTRRKKKKGKKGCTIELHTIPKQSGESSSGEAADQPQRSRLGAPHSPGAAPALDLLSVPATSVPRGSLHNAAVRRIACGRMPPREDSGAAAPADDAAPPPYAAAPEA